MPWKYSDVWELGLLSLENRWIVTAIFLLVPNQTPKERKLFGRP